MLTSHFDVQHYTVWIQCCFFHLFISAVTNGIIRCHNGVIIFTAALHLNIWYLIFHCLPMKIRKIYSECLTLLSLGKGLGTSFTGTFPVMFLFLGMIILMAVEHFVCTAGRVWCNIFSYYNKMMYDL
jgi:hypothetical protein